MDSCLNHGRQEHFINWTRKFSNEVHDTLHIPGMSTVLEGLGKDGTGHSIRSMSRSSHLINNLPNSTLISYSNLSIQQLMKCHTTCRKTTSSHLTQKLFRLCCLARAEQSFQYSVVGHDICRPCTCHLAEVLYCPREILALDVRFDQTVMDLSTGYCTRGLEFIKGCQGTFKIFGTSARSDYRDNSIHIVACRALTLALGLSVRSMYNGTCKLGRTKVCHTGTLVLLEQRQGSLAISNKTDVRHSCNHKHQELHPNTQDSFSDAGVTQVDKDLHHFFLASAKKQIAGRF